MGSAPSAAALAVERPPTDRGSAEPSPPPPQPPPQQQEQQQQPQPPADAGPGKGRLSPKAQQRSPRAPPATPSTPSTSEAMSSDAPDGRGRRAGGRPGGFAPPLPPDLRTAAAAGKGAEQASVGQRRMWAQSRRAGCL